MRTQYRRLLEPAHRDLHDPRQRLHAPLRVALFQKGAPLPVPITAKPRRVARKPVLRWAWKFAVITSVNRDDRKDGGAELFALVIRAIRERVEGCGVEVLVPDFPGLARGDGRLCSRPRRTF